MDTKILLDHEPVADGGYLVRALLRITGEAPEQSERAPLNLALVLDRSGSMAALGKLERAKEAAALLARRLGDHDVLSIVAYDDEVTTLAARQPGSRQEELLARIAAIQPGGMTNLSGGWLRGRELVAERTIGAGVESESKARTEGAPNSEDADRADGGVNRVLLLTDGLANVGITDPQALRDLVGAAAAKGVSTTTIGFGVDYDEQLLRSLADAGGGSTYYIEEPDQAPAVFETELEGLMALAAQNVAVTIRPAPAVDVAAIHHRYPRERTADGALRFSLGDLYALEPRSLLVELLVGEDGAGPIDVATIEVEAHVLLAGGGVEKRTVSLPIVVVPEHGPVVHPEVRRELLLLQAASARETALEDRARGEFREAALTLRQAAQQLAQSGLDDDDVRDEMADLNELAGRFEEQTVTREDAKWMHQRAYGRAWSRTSTVEPLRESRRRRRDER